MVNNSILIVHNNTLIVHSNMVILIYIMRECTHLLIWVIITRRITHTYRISMHRCMVNYYHNKTTSTI